MKKNKNTSNSVRNLVLTALVAGPVALMPTLMALPKTDAALVAAGVLNTLTTTGIDTTAGTGGFKVIANDGTNGTNVRITTNADRAVIDWVQFANAAGVDGTDMVLASGQTLQYVLPSATSAVLNRVSGATASTIAGTITSNGKFFLINPNGITVAASGTIEAPVVVLTSADEDDKLSSYNYYKTYGTLKQLSATPGTLPTNDVVVATDGSGKLTTPGMTGDIYLIGQDVKVAGTVEGSLFVTTLNAGVATLGQAAAGPLLDAGLTVEKNLTVKSNANIALGVGANAALVENILVKGDASLTSNAATIKDEATLGTSTLEVKGTLSTDSTGAVTTLSGKFVTVNAKASNLFITDTEAGLALGTSTLSGNLTVTTANDVAKGNLTSSGTVEFTGAASTVNITLLGNDSASQSAKLVTKGAYTIGTLTAEAGAVKKDTFTFESDANVKITSAAWVNNPNVSVKTSGNISQTDVAGTVTAGSVTLEATGTASTISLNPATAGNNNAITGAISVKGGKGGIDIDNIGAATTIIGASSATGAVTVDATGKAIQLGTGADDVLAFSDNLILKAATVDDTAKNISVTKNLDLTTSGAVTFDLAGHQFGLIKGTTGGNTAIAQKSAVKVAGLAVTGTLSLSSSDAGIGGGSDDTTAGDKVTVTGTTSLKTAAASSIALTNDLNSFGNTITIADNTTDLTIGNVVATAIKTAAGKSITGTTKVVSKVVGSTVTLDGNDGTASGFGNYGTVSITLPASASGAIIVKDTDGLTVKDLTVPGTGTVAISTDNGAIAFSSGVNVTTSSATTITAGGANANITQGADALSITGPVTFSSAKGLTLDNTGNKFGALSITTGGDGSASIKEGEAIVLDAVTIDGKGSLTVDAGTYNITQSGAASFVKASGSTTDGSVTLVGKNVTLDKTYANVGLQGNNIAKAINITTTESATIKQGMSDVKLGTISVGKDLTVDTTGTANNAFVAVSEDAAGKVWVYGKTTLKSNNTTIDLSNTGNNFGPIYVESGSGDIKITEASTMNIRKAIGTGNATLRSELGDIIDTSDKDVAAEVITLNTSGKETKFTAEKGAVTIDSNSANSVGLRNVFVSALKDSKIVSAGTPITLSAGTTVTAGSFSLTTGNQNIGSAGKVSVFGPATFDAGSGDISLTNSSNTFGVLKLLGDDATVYETSSINLAPATSLTGVVSLTSDDQIVTLGTGVVNLTKTGANGTDAWDVTLKAANGITLSTGWFVKGKLKLDSAKLVDLSALSISGNLNGNTPTYTGSLKSEPKP